MDTATTQVLSLQGNQRLPLDDPSRVWLLNRGSVQVFLETPDGARRPLLDQGPGSALFPSLPFDGGCRLAAVALEEAELASVPPALVWRPAVEGGLPASALAAWMRRLAESLGDCLRIDDLLPEDDGSKEAVFSAFDERWREAAARVVRERSAADSERLAARAERDRRLAHEALSRLAGSAGRAGDGLPLDGPPLLAAFRAAARHAGVTVVPPAGPLPEDPRQFLRAAAAASRCRLRQVVLGAGWWQSDAGALVGFRDSGDPVALLPASPGRYDLFNPAEGTRAGVDAGLAARVQPIAFSVYRPFGGSLLTPLDLLRFSLWGQRRTLVTVAAASLLATVLGMLWPMVTGLLIDVVIPEADHALLYQLAGALLAATAGKLAFELVQGYALIRLESSTAHATQAAVWDRLLSMPAAFFRQFSSGDLAARSLAVSTVHRRLSGATLRSLIGGGAALLNVGLMLAYSPGLLWLAIAAGAVTAALTFVSGNERLRSLRPLQALEGRALGLTVELINGVSKLRVAAAERAAFARWAAVYGERQRLQARAEVAQNRLQVFNEAWPVLLAIPVFALGHGRVLDVSGGLAPGAFLAFYAAFGTFVAGTASLSNTAVEAMEDLNLFRRALPILATAPEVDAAKADPGRLSGQIAVEHATFRYREDGPLTLSDVSIRAEPGEFVALVGPSGSGKSTVLRLLLGFERPASGSVFFDGKDLSGLDVTAVRRQLGVVMQSSNLLSGTVFENIASGTAISLDAAWAAAREAGLEADLAAMPMGMHTYISEGGTNLSGGQRQRLMIARALASRPKILLFDEATSALDNRTQAIVTQSLDRLNVTRVVIAHRLSTIQNADRIYVIEAGRVVQEGTFASLAGEDGLFARMMARQML